jgi:hypothetical protein
VGDELPPGRGLGAGVSGASFSRLESSDSTVCNASGNSRPLFSERRKIPAAALGLKKNLSGTVSNSTSANDEDASPPLGHSEVSAVQHSPREVVKPELGQRREYDGEISSTVAGKKSGNVLNEDPSSVPNKVIGDSGELEEQAGSLAGESCSSTGNGDVLAGEASAEEVNRSDISKGVKTAIHGDTAGAQSRSGFGQSSSVQSNTNVSDVLVAGDVGPVLGEDASAPSVGLGLEHDSHPGSLESEVDASDA